MSKVLRLLDFTDHLTFDHKDWLREKTDEFIEQEMKEQEKIEDGNTNEENRVSEKEKFDNYVNPDGDESFSYDDIPF